MAPTPVPSSTVPAMAVPSADVANKAGLSLAGDILEAWAEGFYVGALIILMLIVLCNIRRRVWLHKLIMLEMLLAIWHGTFIFVQDPVYGWYLSSTATLLFISYQLHNVVSWYKIRRFLPRWGSMFFIGTLIAVQPFWIVEAWSNFEYFNGLGNNWNYYTRPWEALARDPWWIFTTCRLVWAIKRSYNYKLLTLIRDSPRFGIMILCMLLSIIFLVTDMIVSADHLDTDSGINPYWRLSLVFKCASDTIFLDDFKSVLDSIVGTALRKAGGVVSYGQRPPKAGAPIQPMGCAYPKRSVSANTTPTYERELNDLPPSTTCSVNRNSINSRAIWNQNLLPHPDSSELPTMEIRRDVTVSQSYQDRVRSCSLDSSNSKQKFLSKPKTAYARGGLRSEGGNGTGLASY